MSMQQQQQQQQQQLIQQILNSSGLYFDGSSQGYRDQQGNWYTTQQVQQYVNQSMQQMQQQALQNNVMMNNGMASAPPNQMIGGNINTAGVWNNTQAQQNSGGQLLGGPALDNFDDLNGLNEGNTELLNNDLFNDLNSNQSQSMQTPQVNSAPNQVADGTLVYGGECKNIFEMGQNLIKVMHNLQDHLTIPVRKSDGSTVYALVDSDTFEEMEDDESLTLLEANTGLINDLVPEGIRVLNPDEIMGFEPYINDGVSSSLEELAMNLTGLTKSENDFVQSRLFHNIAEVELDVKETATEVEEEIGEEGDNTEAVEAEALNDDRDEAVVYEDVDPTFLDAIVNIIDILRDTEVELDDAISAIHSELRTINNPIKVKIYNHFNSFLTEAVKEAALILDSSVSYVRNGVLGNKKFIRDLANMGAIDTVRKFIASKAEEREVHINYSEDGYATIGVSESVFFTTLPAGLYETATASDFKPGIVIEEATSEVYAAALVMQSLSNRVSRCVVASEVIFDITLMGNGRLSLCKQIINN